MTSEITPVQPAAPKKTRFSIRVCATVLCLVLGTVLLPVGIIGFWGQKTVTNTESISQIAAQTVSDPVVQAEIAQWATDEIVGVIEEADVLADVPALKQLFDALPISLDPLLYPVILKIVQSDVAQATLATAIEQAQTALIRILQGDQVVGTSVQNGEVVIDLNGVAAAIRNQLSQRGINVPTSPRFSEKLKEFSANRDPIVLVNQQQLEQARTIYALTVPIATWLIFLSLALFVAAFALTKKRPRMTVIIGALWFFGALLVVAGVAFGQSTVNNAFAGTLFEQATNIFYSNLINNLYNGSRLIAVLGLVLVIAGAVWIYLGRRKAKATGDGSDSGDEPPSVGTAPEGPEQVSPAAPTTS